MYLIEYMWIIIHNENKTTTTDHEWLLRLCHMNNSRGFDVSLGMAFVVQNSYLTLH